MKNLYLKLLISMYLLVSCLNHTKAQCPVGWTAAQTNWDWLDYLTNTGNYAPSANFPGVPASLAANQAYAIGTNRFTIAYAGGITCTLGENINNTAEAGSFGTGADVQYLNNGTITITFDTLVRNVQFSLYDIDENQTAQVTADDGTTAVLVNMNLVSAGNIVIVGSPGLTPIATANGTSATNSDTKGSLNISVGGGATGVKKIIITLGGTAGDFWLSDISACVVRTFPNNYFIDAKPFAGQPTFILATPDSNSIAYIDTATGKAKFLMSGNLAPDANLPKFVNGLGYDHRNHYLYYVHDFGTNAYNTRTLRMWDYNTETISTLNLDVNTIGIPTFDGGVESAASSFYDGALYFGIEGNNSARTSGRESIVWRIDFDASRNPVKSTQVWATPSDNGSGTRLHDWNDFVVKDGILYNFDGAGTTAQDDYHHFNLQTGVMLQDYTTMPTHNTPRQTAITWAGTIYWVYDSIGVYNEAGSVGLKKKIIGTTPTNFSPDWAIGTIISSTRGASGDATGPFKTKTDFGDAPATYDPGTSDPATHERDSTLRIGASFDREFVKVSSALANGDGADEDGLAFVPIFNPPYNAYAVQVNVYNNLGAAATLIAWFDYNGNGIFDASEAITPISVPSTTATQSIWLYWSGISSPLPNGSYTYLRIRITSASNSMTSANMNGYYSNGEVEDYRVVVDNFPLSSHLINFDAVLKNKKVDLDWSMAEDGGNTLGYTIEKSTDNFNWQKIYSLNANGSNGTFKYHNEDVNPLPNISYYRIKISETSGRVSYSPVRTVSNNNNAAQVFITPNPAKTYTTLRLDAEKGGQAKIQFRNIQGGVVLVKDVKIFKGNNTIEILFPDSFTSGTYIVKIFINEEIIQKKLTINK